MTAVTFRPAVVNVTSLTFRAGRRRRFRARTTLD